ncbi:MAG TPA: beta-ketoacyl-[acyl-carrier-protein] synthase family protein [bacterium]|nr:beta-ketoacyl-[acyl-carrier-protein] synthase family protein [bacterium]
MSGGIVVTGWGMVTPLGFNSRFTWDALLEGINPFKPLKGREWEKFEAPRAAQALEVWIPHTLIRRDRSLQLAALAAEEAYQQAELSKVSADRIGTTFSSSKGGVGSLLTAGTGPYESWDYLTDYFPHSAGLLLRQRLGFTGPGLSVSSACSTGIGSIAMGVRLLQDGECDAVITGSTESSIYPLIYAGFQNMGVFSRQWEGPAAFDLKRDGFLMGEGAAAMVLEREESAKKRKAPIQVRLSGWALGADAYHPFEMEPRGQAIVTVIRKALKKAKLHSLDIGYINAHGTATQLNDRVESQAIHKVFGDKRAWVSSTKGATGHLLGAAGSVEAVLSVIALKEGVLPETRNLNFPDPQCKVRHVETGGVKQRVKHVLSLSYGFGGQLGAVIFSKL